MELIRDPYSLLSAPTSGATNAGRRRDHCRRLPVVRPQFRGGYCLGAHQQLEPPPVVRPRFRGDRCYQKPNVIYQTLSSAPASGATAAAVPEPGSSEHLSSAPNSGATAAARSLRACAVSLSSAPNSGATAAAPPVAPTVVALSSAPNSGATAASAGAALRAVGPVVRPQFRGDRCPLSNGSVQALLLSSAPNSGATAAVGVDESFVVGLSSAPNSGATAAWKTLTS